MQHCPVNTGPINELFNLPMEFPRTQFPAAGEQNSFTLSQKGNKSVILIKQHDMQNRPLKQHHMGRQAIQGWKWQLWGIPSLGLPRGPIKPLNASKEGPLTLAPHKVPSPSVPSTNWSDSSFRQSRCRPTSPYEAVFTLNSTRTKNTLCTIKEWRTILQ